MSPIEADWRSLWATAQGLWQTSAALPKPRWALGRLRSVSMRSRGRSSGTRCRGEGDSSRRHRRAGCTTRAAHGRQSCRAQRPDAAEMRAPLALRPHQRAPEPERAGCQRAGALSALFPACPHEGAGPVPPSGHETTGVYGPNRAGSGCPSGVR